MPPPNHCDTGGVPDAGPHEQRADEDSARGDQRVILLTLPAYDARVLAGASADPSRPGSKRCYAVLRGLAESHCRGGYHHLEGEDAPKPLLPLRVKAVAPLERW
eukprot:6188440-Pleurochrysis_carterae.AAC.1